LGSSSAFTVGFINLLHRMRGTQLTKFELAREAIFVEQKLLRENVGIQDQIHAAFGGLARYEFQADDFSIHPLRIGRARRALLSQSMVIVYTGRARHASAILHEQETRTRSGANADCLSTLYRMTREAAGILERAGVDERVLGDLGALLDEAWHIKQRLSGAISDDAVARLYAEGKSIGAWGGKLLGAGGGGFMFFLVHPNKQEAFRQRFGDARASAVRMEDDGAVVDSLRPHPGQ
jgi:D-glycero-alpha-D-manno-heptose-7-phosphate kinase